LHSAPLYEEEEEEEASFQMDLPALHSSAILLPTKGSRFRV